MTVSLNTVPATTVVAKQEQAPKTQSKCGRFCKVLLPVAAMAAAAVGAYMLMNKPGQSSTVTETAATTSTPEVPKGLERLDIGSYFTERNVVIVSGLGILASAVYARESIADKANSIGFVIKALFFVKK